MCLFKVIFCLSNLHVIKTLYFSLISLCTLQGKLTRMNSNATHSNFKQILRMKKRRKTSIRILQEENTRYSCKFYTIYFIRLSCEINFTRFLCVKWFSLIKHLSRDYRMIFASILYDSNGPQGNGKFIQIRESTR